MNAWRRSMRTAVWGAVITAACTWAGITPVSAQQPMQKPATVERILPEQTILFSIQFMDGFRAKVTDNKTRKTTWIHLEPNKEEYLRRGIYDAEGKLKRQINGYAETLVELIPYAAPDGSIRYVGRQRLWGIDGDDLIAQATSIWTVHEQKAQFQHLAVTQGDPDDMPSPDVWINEGFSMDKDIAFVLDTKYADVTGDGVKDNILLIGHKPGAQLGIPAENLRIVVREGKWKQQTHFPVGVMDEGFLPKLSIRHINQDGVKDILVTIPTDNGRVYSAISWKDNRPAALIDQAELNHIGQLRVSIDAQGVGTAVQAVVPAQN